MIWNAAIQSTPVVRHILLVGCTEPWLRDRHCRLRSFAILSVQCDLLNCRCKNSSKVLCIEHDQVARALASDRLDQAFNLAVLPGQAERGGPVPDTDASPERFAKCPVIVSNEIFRCVAPRERFGDLARTRPSDCGSPQTTATGAVRD
jgi:hypothetical protein